MDVRLQIWSIFITEKRNCFPRSTSSSCTTNSVDVRLDRLGEICIVSYYSSTPSPLLSSLRICLIPMTSSYSIRIEPWFLYRLFPSRSIHPFKTSSRYPNDDLLSPGSTLQDHLEFLNSRPLTQHYSPTSQGVL